MIIPTSQAQPGDIAGFKTHSAFGTAIGIGEWIRRSDRAYRDYHHIGVVSEPGKVVQAARRVDEVTFEEAAGGGDFDVFRCPPNVNRELVVAQARTLIGDPYDLLTIACITLTLETPNLVAFRREGAWICSGLAAYCLKAGGWLHDFRDLYQVTPAELLEALQAAVLPTGRPGPLRTALES